MLVFFGDSITEGSNCLTNFPEILGKNFYVYNSSISGTTIGEYSIYPVDGNSLLERYKKSSHLPLATKIFLEYGVNDVASVMCGFTTMQTVIISFIKALDGIRQINNNAEIIFLAVSLDHDIINEHSKLQCNYLKNDYFKGYDFVFPTHLCTEYYEQLIDAVSKKVKVVPMIEDIRFFDELWGCISDDNIHPNAKGHEIIAETIKKYI